MILYEFNCDRQHGFEAWFKDGDTCDRQIKRRALECPVCGSAKVAKALMAPRIGRKGGHQAPSISGNEIRPADVSAPAAAAPMPGPVADNKMAVIPAELRKALLEARRQIESNCDYVGDKFADEARKIHEGEAEARGIYGEATDEQHEELIEDGIDVTRIPWVPRGDA